MGARLLDGRKVAADIQAQIATDVRILLEAGTQPGLAVVLVGDDSASKAYVGSKERLCAKLGIYSEVHRLADDIDEEALLGLLAELGAKESLHGILVQLPLPDHVSTRRILNAIPPGKDVDGLHPINRGKLCAGEDTFVPCTPLGIQELLHHSGISTEGKHVVILGRSNLVGLPLANLLVQKSKRANATVTICHSRTKGIKEICRSADILVAAIGRTHFVNASMVAPGCTVVDVGINRIEVPATEKGYRLVGDVDFESVAEIANAITPVPGGVGPMTVTMLARNVVTAAQLFANEIRV